MRCLDVSASGYTTTDKPRVQTRYLREKPQQLLLKQRVVCVKLQAMLEGNTCHRWSFRCDGCSPETQPQLHI